MRKNILVLAALMSVSGCDGLDAVPGIGETTCLTPAGHDTVFSIFHEQIERSIDSDLTGDFTIAGGKIRAAIKEVDFKIADVRTSKEDPNSTKKFCSGTLRVSFPVSAVNEAEQTFAATESGTISDFANQYNIERNANSFDIPIDFTVQPTDDGQSIFAEVEDAGNAFEFVAGIVGAQLLRSKVVNAQIESERLEAEQAKAERDAEAAQAAVDITSAQEADELANQSINATWAALDQETRDQLLAVQRAWIKKKDADCRLEAARSSTDEKRREIARLYCNTRMNEERASELENYLGYYD